MGLLSGLEMALSVYVGNGHFFVRFFLIFVLLHLVLKFYLYHHYYLQLNNKKEQNLKYYDVMFSTKLVRCDKEGNLQDER